jgi:hypothetical protein
MAVPKSIIYHLSQTLYGICIGNLSIFMFYIVYKSAVLVFFFKLKEISSFLDLIVSYY